ncbi:30S ribosomal protein S3 [candidate division WOR-3 bacterium JGI_Cruoil_03_44_89]|uniref:Small ribosomal subunit protein uS3 n=1 Tax=candidate division WOR-3 bacterium JGI_Cruoil_03_44_89 TaxID=1973748 RepID=A0A235BVP8_UNCW3|nr:MAG: 30S ribosomal protein S3 [candidate division WOR-3 bacterium JGI_Cruoil_03_44_89]
MGQKTHPYGFRLGITKNWKSRWITSTKFKEYITEDDTLRRYIEKRFVRAAISEIEIERTEARLTISIHSARPGIIIGRRGIEVERLKNELTLLTKGKDVYINIEEVKVPETDARIVAQNIARQIEERVSHRRAMKRAVQQAVRMGALGIKVMCKGRLGGAEIARTEWYRRGRVPLQTLRANIDYSYIPSKTVSGVVGVKVWIYKGNVEI